MILNPKHRSHIITDGRDRAGARAMLKGIGFTDEDLKRPIIGVANTWTETMPCNYHLRRLAVKVKEGVRAAGGTPMEFNTIAISDGVTMGTEGMKASLVSREIIADSIELVGRGHMFDAVIALAACDKTMPGSAMGLLRLDVPGFVLYGGTIMPRDYITKTSFENAIASVAATGGSTNAVLHLLAMAREIDIPLVLEDFDRVSARTPIIADLMPGGKYAAVDVDRAGGIQLIT